MQGRPAEEPGILSSLSCCLSAAGLRFLGILSPPGNWAPLTVGLPGRHNGAPDPDGVSMFRTRETRLGPGALYTRGQRCLHGHVCIP